MSAASPSDRAALRAFVVVALSLLVLGAAATELLRFWAPIGQFGLHTDGDDVVGAVWDNSPASRARIQVGDSVDLSSTPPQFRYPVMFAFVLEPNQSITFGLVHRAVRRTVTLFSAPTPYSQLDRMYDIVILASVLLFVFLGGALVLLRPSLTTWGFFVYCLGANPFVFAVASLLFPFQWGFVSNTLFFNLLANASVVGLLVFALGFLNEPMLQRRLTLLRLMPWLFVTLVLFGLFQLYQGFWVGGPPGERLNRISFAVSALLTLLTMATFILTYVRARGANKQRIRWIVVGFGIYLVASYAQWILVAYPWFGVPNWLPLSLQLCSIIVPLTVAYAVIKHRVIDVTFVVSRAIVLTVLTSFVVMVFALIDWIFMRKLEQTGLGVAAGILAVTTLGFTAQALHRRVDTIVDKTFFRRRHAAEERLTRLARELPDVQSVQTLSAILVNEPLNAFGLTSAALFRRREGNRFEREDSIGWPPQSLRELDLEVAPLSNIADVRETKRIRWQDQSNVVFPSLDAHPVLTMPIVIGHNLRAIAFYGPHENGADFDPEEIGAINGMMIPAAAAYHHLEAEDVRRDSERVRLEAERVLSRWTEVVDQEPEPEINPS